MKKLSVLSLLSLLAALNSPFAQADGIRYDQIPSDATGYAYLDIAHLIASPLMQTADVDKNTMNQLATLFGAQSDITFYVPKSDGPSGFVVFLHSTSLQKYRQRIDASFAHDAIHLAYQNQELIYTSLPIERLLALAAREPVKQPSGAQTMPAAASIPATPAQNQAAREQYQKLLQEVDAKRAEATAISDAVNKAEREKGSQPNRFTIGLGSPNGAAAGATFSRGPTYLAFIGDDTILAASDLPAITQAINVLQGKSPSLATQDPQNLRMTSPPGVFFVGAGLTAEYSKETPKDDAISTPPAAPQPFGLDMFGSFTAKAQLARFDFGEDDHQFFLDTLIIMKDTESAGQLKNLVVGVKALIGLTHTEAAPLLDPAELTTTDKDVSLHWAWPNDKLPELLNLIKAQSHAGPARH